MKELWSILGLCNVFHRFLLTLALVSALLSKMNLNGHMETLRRLTVDKTSALETLKAKLSEPLCCSFHVHKAPVPFNLAHATSRLIVVFWKWNMKEPTEQ